MSATSDTDHEVVFRIPVSAFYSGRKMGRKRKAPPKKVKKLEKTQTSSKEDDKPEEVQKTPDKESGTQMSSSACGAGPSPSSLAKKKRSLSDTVKSLHQKKDTSPSPSPSPSQKFKKSRMDLQKAREALKILQSMGTSLMDSDRFVLTMAQKFYKFKIKSIKK